MGKKLEQANAVLGRSSEKSCRFYHCCKVSTRYEPHLRDDLTKVTVSITITYAFRKDGTVELEPKIGSVGITEKFIVTRTTTQKMVLTFELKSKAK